MRSPSPLVGAWLLAIVLIGCAEKAPPAPRPISVTPNQAANDLDLRVIIAGEGLSPRFVTDFNKQSETTVKDTFRAFLGDNELRDVALQSNGTLQATVPSGLSPGKFTLIVEDPIGARGELADAFEVLDAALTPRKLAITSAPQTLRTGICSQPATLELRSGTDAPIATPSALTVSLAALPLRFYSDAACTAELTSLTFAAGQTTATFHFASIIAGTHPLTASATGLSNATQDETIVNAANCIPSDADGTPCDDANACTTGESCQGGTCTGGTAVVCVALSPCHDVGSCNPSTGVCSNPAKAEGATCEDGLSCTTGERCQLGVCGAPTQFSGCLNTPPRACLTVVPAAGAIGTARTFSAVCSTDLEDPQSALEARFDFTGDDTFDTAFGAQTATNTPGTAATLKAQVEVRDDAGVSAFATRYYVASSTLDDVVVTTAVDENDANASPLVPGGSGLSLREAMTYANGAAGRVVRFSGPMAINVAVVPRITIGNFALVGEPGVVITFTQAQGGLCFQLDGTNNRFIGVKVAGCPGVPLDVGGTNALIADNDLRGTNPIRLDGAGTQFLNNDVHDLTGTDAVRVTAANITLDGNRIHDNAGTGITIVQGAGTGHVLQRNIVFNNAGGGLKIENGISAPTIRHNVFDSNGVAGLSAATLASPAVVLNNIFSRNQGAAISGATTAFSRANPNLLFRNTTTTAFDAGVNADPLFVALDGGDLRIRPESAAANAGVDAGLDVNGPAAGRWNGTNPDLGAHELP